MLNRTSRTRIAPDGTQAIGDEGTAGMSAERNIAFTRGRRPRVGATRCFALAAGAVILVGLALPWGDVASTQYVPGYFISGFCSTDYYDGTLDCTPGYVAPGLPMQSSYSISGFGQPVRVLVVAAAVLAVLAVRRGSSRLLKVATVIALAGGGAFGRHPADRVDRSGRLPARRRTRRARAPHTAAGPRRLDHAPAGDGLAAGRTITRRATPMTTPRPPGHRPDGFGPQPAGLSPPPPQGPAR